MSVTFYSNALSPPCRAVWLTLKFLGIDFTLKETDFLTKQQKSAEIISVNPRGKLPALKDGDLCLGESRAIMQYLCNRYGKKDKTSLYPKDPVLRARIDQILYIDECVVDTMYKYTNFYKVVFLKQNPGLGDIMEVKKMLGFYEAFLRCNKYLAGDSLTIADISAINSVTVLDFCLFGDYKEFPRLCEWKESMKKLPWYEECVGCHVADVTEKYQSSLRSHIH